MSYFTVETACHAVSEAYRAEEHMRHVAQSRRPTAAESLVARAAYARAAEAQKFLNREEAKSADAHCTECDGNGYHVSDCPNALKGDR